MNTEDFAFEDGTGFRLRDYQREWMQAVEHDRITHSRLLIDAPGGTGKTSFFAALAHREWTLRKGRTLILENRDKLVRQTADRIRNETGLECEIEMAEQRASPFAPIVVASVASLGRVNRLTGFADTHFAIVVADEAHHSCAPLFKRVMDYFYFGADSLADGWKPPEDGLFTPKCLIVGTTATPDIGARKNLGSIYQKFSVRYSYLNAIEDGWLVGLKEHNIPVRIDTRKFRVKRTGQGMDFSPEDESAALIPIIEELAQQIVDLASTKKTMAFLPSLECARLMAEALNRRGLKATYVSGVCLDKDEKTEVFAAHGPGICLCLCALYVEGADFPDVDCVAWMRATLSRSFYCLDEQTEILTDTGWKRDVAVGENVAAFDLKTGKIVHVPALGVGRRPLYQNEKFVSIKSRSADIRVTDNHRMIYDHNRLTGWKIKDARSLAALRHTSYIPVCGIADTQIGVPLTDDELKFIGWVMTDGCINKEHKQIVIAQGEHQPWLEEIEKCIVGCGFKFTRASRVRKSQFRSNSRSVTWTVSYGKPRSKDKHLTGWGRLEPWLSKTIAEPLMGVSPAQFDTLLSAINLGDGTKFRTIKYQSGTNVITSGNKEFCDRLQILGVRCGYRSAIFTAPGWKGGVKYRVTLSKKTFVNIGGKIGDRSEWEFDQGAPGERVWCVENRLGTLVTRRNGKVAIVGNCQGLYRATRVLPGIVSDDMTAGERRVAIAKSAKPYSLIISPFFISDRIDICSVHDLFVDRNEFPDAKKKMKGDLTDPEKIRDFIAALRKAADKHAHKQARTIDPVKFSLSLGDASLANYTPETQADASPATKEELDFLLEKGLDTTQVRNSGHAQKLIARFMERERLGLASPKMLMQLLLLGFPEENAVLIKKGLAGVLVGKRIRYKKPAQNTVDTFPA